MRAGLNQETVTEYADTMRRSNSYEPFPPIVVYFDGTDYWLGDGFHRYTAAFQAFGHSCTIPADVRTGTRRDAILHAAGANADHGQRRTNADKRRAVETLLRDEEWGKWPQAQIAKACGVTREYVSRVFGEIRPSCDRSQDAERIVERNGQTYTMQTGNIGSQHRTPPPTPTPQRTLEASVPAFTPPAERSQPVTPRPLTDNEVEAVIWKGITHHARIPERATSQQQAAAQLAWLQIATAGDFGKMLNPGMTFTAEQLERIKAGIEAILGRIATPPTEELDNDEWYTPAYILEPARQALRIIDLDPASCATANEVVKATVYYEKLNDGLSLPWRGSIWLNPPYSDPYPWIEKLFAEYDAKRVTSAIVLVNTANSPKWARLLWSNTQASVCMLSSRIKFWRPDRPDPKGFDRDQMLWWVGPTTQPNSHERFRRAFDGFGPFR